MAYITSKEFESDQKDKVYLDDPETLKKAHCELLSNSSILSKYYKNLWIDFKKLSKDHMELEKTFQDKVEVSLDKSTQTCKACETFKEKKSKLS